MWATAVELAPMVGVWRRLLEEHQPDGRGRCRSCTRGGTGISAIVWPCTLFAVAEHARRYHERPVDGAPR
jgi:hypothetical protein